MVVRKIRPLLVLETVTSIPVRRSKTIDGNAWLRFPDERQLNAANNWAPHLSNFHYINFLLSISVVGIG